MTELLPGVDTPSDAELISRVRGGDVDAYGELFSRHVEAARRLARQLMRGPDVDDLVSDAFAKTLTVLQAGGGPDVAFRAYLLTSVRRLHVDRIRASKRVQPSDDMTLYDNGLPFQDTAVASFENGAAARAFSSLPERWQLVLWHLEVEGQKPADMAPLLGMSANSVSALAYRAREGLRQAFLTMHLADCATEQCRWVNEHLGGYVRKGLSRRDTAKIEQHLDGCRSCTAMYVELHEVNSDLAAIIAPLVLGAAAAGYVSSTGGAGLAGVSALFGRIRDAVTAHSGGGAAGAGGGGAASGAGTGAAGAATGGAVATAAGALTAGGVVAASVAAVTTAALVFGGAPKERITEADRPVGVVQTPASGPARAAAGGATMPQGADTSARSAPVSPPGTPSASTVVVVAKDAAPGSVPGVKVPRRGADPAQDGSKDQTPVTPTLGLSDALGLPVPSLSVPAPRQDGPVTDTSEPDSAATPAPGPSQQDPEPAPDLTPNPPKPGTLLEHSPAHPATGTTAGGAPDTKTPTSDLPRLEERARNLLGGKEPTARSSEGSTPGGDARVKDQTAKRPAEQPDDRPADQPEPDRTGRLPSDLAGVASATSKLPAALQDAQSSPGQRVTAPRPAPTRLTIRDVRVSGRTLEFQIRAAGRLPADVTLTLADGTRGIAFVPNGANGSAGDLAVREGNALQVRVPLVFSLPASRARLFFTVTSGDGFTFVDSSGRRLRSGIEPTYDTSADEPKAQSAEPAGSAPRPDTSSSDAPHSGVTLMQGSPVIVGQDGAGRVWVSVQGVDEAMLLAQDDPFVLVPVGAGPAVAQARVTRLVAGARPGTFQVWFQIPREPLDQSDQWRLRIGEDGPVTDPFRVAVVPEYGGFDNDRSQAPDRSSDGPGEFPADLDDGGSGLDH